jgi:hypothetical protein
MLITVTNRHDGCLYYVSVINHHSNLVIRKELPGGYLFLDLAFNFKYEAAIWKRRPIPVFSKPLLIVDIDDVHVNHQLRRKSSQPWSNSCCEMSQLNIYLATMPLSSSINTMSSRFIISYAGSSSFERSSN